MPLASWLTVLVLMSASKNGIAAREVERLIGVTPETAWFMLHRLREAMRRESVLAPRGVVKSMRDTPAPSAASERAGRLPGFPILTS